MATGPVITLNTRMNPPANINAVANQIRKGLGNINANVNVKINQGSLNQLNNISKALQGINNGLLSISNNAGSAAAGLGKISGAASSFSSVSKAIGQAGASTNKLNASLAQSSSSIAAVTARFSSFILVAQAFNKVAASIGDGVTEALDFQRELVRIKQVGDDSASVVKSIGDEAIRLGKNLGVSSNELIKVASTLRQAGLNANDTKTALETLAKTRLSPSFTDLNNTVEGAIAVIGQFKLSTKDLEKSFDSINSVSKAFAVESNDLITGVRLAGAAFSSAGGNLNEFLAIFTAVRAQTRESAENIGTGLKTIFTRLQRRDSVDALKNLGINLRDAKGNFVGVYEGIKRIGDGLSQINPRSQQFADIIEQVGGIRQINKILPLINNQKTIQEALNVAKSSSNSLDKDSITGQEALIVKLTKLKESFNEIFKILSENKQILGFIDQLARLGEVAVSLVKKLEPIIPALLLIGGIKIAKGLGTVAGTLGKKALGFNTGGRIPGVGSGDKEHILAEPGEFMIRKSVAKKLGYDNLRKLNSGQLDLPGYANGGEILSSLKGQVQSQGIQQADIEDFVKDFVNKQYKGQNRPRAGGGLYYKKADFLNIALREAQSVASSFGGNSQSQSIGRSIGVSDFGPTAKAYKQGVTNPTETKQLFDSANFRNNSGGAPVRVIIDGQTIEEFASKTGAAVSRGNSILNSAKKTTVPPSQQGSYKFASGKPDSIEFPADDDLFSKDNYDIYGFARSELKKPPRFPQQASGIDPYNLKKQKFVNKDIKDSEAGIVPNTYIPPSAQETQDFLNGTGYADPKNNRYFDRRKSQYPQADFRSGVIRAQESGLVPNTKRKPFTFGVAVTNEDTDFINGTGRFGAFDENNLDTFFGDPAVDPRKLGRRRNKAAQQFINGGFGRNRKLFDSDGISGISNLKTPYDPFSDDPLDEKLGKYYRAPSPETKGGQKRFATSDDLIKYLGQDSSRGKRKVYEQSEIRGFQNEKIPLTSVGKPLQSVQSLYQGKNSSSPVKYQKALDQVTTLLLKQVEGLQKGKITEDQYNQAKIKAASILESNSYVQTNGQGRITGLGNNSVSSSIARKGIGSRFASFREGLNAIPGKVSNYVQNYGQKDTNFSGVGNFYATQGLGANNTTYPLAKPKGPGLRSKLGNLKGVGKVGLTAAAATLLAAPFGEPGDGGLLGSLGRIGSRGLQYGAAGGFAGGLAGTAALPGIGTVSLGTVGAITAGIAGIGHGIYDEVNGASTFDHAKAKDQLLSRPDIQEFIQGQRTLGFDKNDPNSFKQDSGGLQTLTRLNNITAGQIGTERKAAKGIRGFLPVLSGLGLSDASANEILNDPANTAKIAGFKQGSQGFAQKLFKERLESGTVTSKNFNQYRNTPEFRQLTEALNTKVGDATTEAVGRGQAGSKLQQQLQEFEKEKAARDKVRQEILRENSVINQLNFQYSKSIAALAQFIDKVGIAGEKLGEDFTKVSGLNSASNGEGGALPFKFKPSYFGEQGKFLQGFAGKGGVIEGLKEGLPSIIEASIAQIKTNPNLSINDAIKNNLQGKGLDPTVLDTIVARAKSNSTLTNDYESGKAPEVISGLLKSFEPFTEAFKRLSQEGEEAGRKFVAGLNQYSDNINKLNDGLNKSAGLSLNTDREVARQRSSNSIGSTPTDFLSFQQLSAPFDREQNRLTGLGADSFNPEAIGNLLNQRKEELQQGLANGDAVKVQGAQTAIQQLTKALENLSDTSKSAAGIQEKLAVAEDRFNKDRQSRLNSTEGFINADPGQRRNILRNRNLGRQAVLAGNLNALPGGVLGRNAQGALAGLAELGDQEIFAGFRQKGFQQRRNRNGRPVGRRRAVFEPVFAAANDLREGLLERAGGQGVPRLAQDRNDLRGLLNQANANAEKAQNILIKNIETNNDKFLTDLKGVFTEFFGKAGGVAPDIQGNQLNPNGPQPVAPQIPLKQKRGLSFVNPNAQGQAQNQGGGGIIGSYNSINTSLLNITKALQNINIPSEISINLSSNPIVVELNGAELLGKFSEQIQQLVYTSVADAVSKKAQEFVKAPPFKV